MCRVMLLAFISRALIGRFFCYTTGLSTVLLSVFIERCLTSSISEFIERCFTSLCDAHIWLKL
jgi:hypothetical protein